MVAQGLSQTVLVKRCLAGSSENGSAVANQGTHRAAGIKVWVSAVLQRHVAVLHGLFAVYQESIVNDDEQVETDQCPHFESMKQSSHQTTRRNGSETQFGSPAQLITTKYKQLYSSSSNPGRASPLHPPRTPPLRPRRANHPSASTAGHSPRAQGPGN